MQRSLNFDTCRIVIIGDAILDEYLLGDVNRISPEAPVPVVHIRDKTNTLGGAGNVALNLISLGCKVSLFGSRGNDETGKTVSKILKENTIDDFMIVDPIKPTTRKTRIIGHGQQLLRLDEEEVGELSDGQSEGLFRQFRSIVGNIDAVILSDYGKGVLIGDLSRKVIELCIAKEVPVFIDPKRVNWERYNGALCVTPNVSELEEISHVKIGKNERLLVEAARSIQQQHSIEWIIVTRGADGMCLIGRDSVPFFIKTTAREVFDVSGAGDTVIATLTACVTSGLSFQESVEIANIAAGIVVGKVGSQPISLAELEAETRLRGSSSGGTGTGKSSTLSAAEIRIKMWQAGGEKIVFFDPSFEVLDSKAVRFLLEAKRQGDRLVIGVHEDHKEKDGGSEKLLQPQQDRIDILSALSCIDLIIPFDRQSMLHVYKTLRPDVVIKQPDQLIETGPESQFVESYGGLFHLLS